MKKKNNFGGGFLAVLIILLFGLTQGENTESENITLPLAPDTTTEVKQKEQEKKPETKKTVVHLPILMYHYIRDVDKARDKLGKGLSVSPALFEQQMRYLMENDFEVAALEDLGQAWEGKTLQEKSIVLTFDDGYLDFYTNAWPILKKYGLKATIFVMPNFFNRESYMNANQILELDKSGLITVATHGMNHADLLLNMTPAQMQHEILEGKNALEQMLGHSIKFFAYPFGHYNPAAIKIVKDAKFNLAITTEFGYDHAEKQRYYTSRVRIHGDADFEKFKKLIEPSSKK